MDMTDKLAIVKAFSCGASLFSLCVICLSVPAERFCLSVFMVMFTQRSRSKLRNNDSR